jgi:hypothetical protein
MWRRGIKKAPPSRQGLVTGLVSYLVKHLGQGTSLPSSMYQLPSAGMGNGGRCRSSFNNHRVSSQII